jgi:hypothetical protein
MDRRNFIGSVIATLAAPAIVRADSLMRIVPMKSLILWGDGIHDDADALNAVLRGQDVYSKTDCLKLDRGAFKIEGGNFYISKPINAAVWTPGTLNNCKVQMQDSMSFAFMSIGLKNISLQSVLINKTSTPYEPTIVTMTL